MKFSGASGHFKRSAQFQGFQTKSLLRCQQLCLQRARHHPQQRPPPKLPFHRLAKNFLVPTRVPPPRGASSDSSCDLDSSASRTRRRARLLRKKMPRAKQSHPDKLQAAAVTAIESNLMESFFLLRQPTHACARSPPKLVRTQVRCLLHVCGSRHCGAILRSYYSSKVFCGLIASPSTKSLGIFGIFGVSATSPVRTTTSQTHTHKNSTLSRPQQNQALALYSREMQTRSVLAGHDVSAAGDLANSAHPALPANANAKQLAQNYRSTPCQPRHHVTHPPTWGDNTPPAATRSCWASFSISAQVLSPVSSGWRVSLTSLVTVRQCLLIGVHAPRQALTVPDSGEDKTGVSISWVLYLWNDTSRPRLWRQSRVCVPDWSRRFVNL